MKISTLAAGVTRATGIGAASEIVRAADLARDEGRLADAARLYAKVPAMSGRRRGALIQRGNMLKDLTRFDEAKLAYRAAWKINSDDPDLALQQGHLAKRSGRLDEALSWYEKAGPLGVAELQAFDRVGIDPEALFAGQLAIDPSASARTLALGVREALESGALDVDYYRSRYSKTKSVAEIYDEFLRSSRFNGRSYSAGLDSLGFMLSNRDLSFEAFDSFDGFRLSGDVGDRGVSPRYRRFSTVENAFPAGLAGLAKRAPIDRIAIHIHLFYPDYAARFRRFLSRFPQPYELLVSSGADVSDADLALLASLPNMTRMTVKRSTNRGRNFGPMLVDFRHELRRFDVACHLHSKKSLFSGREQAAWASYQIEYLVGDPHVVRDHLAVFESDPDMAVIAPVPYWNSPYFASHWLQNEHVGGALLARLGVASSQGFLSYPVGGMFWFRPARLKRLLDAPWSYDDFPPEAGQTDGTVQHAIERSISLVARDGDGRTAYYEPWTHRYGLDGYDVLAEYRRHGPEVILDAADRAKIVSFDVFDTLFYRESLDKEVGKRAVADWLATYGEPRLAADFLLNRNRAEMELREERAFAGDVTIHEIYERLRQRGHVPDTGALKLSALEFEADLRDQRPRTSVVDLVNTMADRGHRVIFVSDTYYSQSQVRRMIIEAGVRSVGEVFVSSEMRLRKDTTRVWPHLANGMGVALDQILHVGDNVVSDVQMAGDLRIANRLVLSLLDKASYLFGRNLNAPEQVEELKTLGLAPAIIAAGKNPFFV